MGKNPDDIRREVSETYAGVARSKSSCCGPTANTSCCGTDTPGVKPVASTRMGYSEDDSATLPQGSDMGLGCGNPQAIADLRLGEVVVDLGAGGGLDCFLAVAQVGDSGHVIGIDMIPEMVRKARANAREAAHGNVEFRLGEIEHLPVADGEADVVMSNCVINLSPDKQAVWSEAYRILKPGGRIAVADIVLSAPVPDEVRENVLGQWSGCAAGADTVDVLHDRLKRAAFTNIRIDPRGESKEFIKDWMPNIGLEKYVVSAFIQARKPS